MKKQQIVRDVEIVDTGVKGQAIGKLDQNVFLLDQGVPGDIVDIQIKRRKKSFFLARVLKITSPSPHRTTAFCKHFDDCGGCKWQNIEYGKQLELKEKSVTDAFVRIGKLPVSTIKPIIPAPELKFFRNKLEYSFAPQRWLTINEIEKDKEIIQEPAAGFHVPGRFDKILNIEYCHLQSDLSNKVRNGLRQFAIDNNFDFNDPYTHKGLLRNLLVKNTLIGDYMLIVVFGENEQNKIKTLMEYLTSGFPEIKSFYYVINEKLNDSIYDLEHFLYKGSKFIREKIGEYSFDFGPLSFFQVNPLQTLNLFNVVRSFCNLKENDVIYDLYCGVGTIGQYVAGNSNKLIGLEVIPEAIELAKHNANLNQIENASYYCGTVEEVLNEDFFNKEGKPDIVLVDPPRAGLHYNVISSILRAEPEKIIYVSCNPATQARDISFLTDKYEIKAIQAVDMFPHTYHVENVAFLQKI